MPLRFDHLSEQRLMGPASIAIWGRKKIIVALAFSVWIINVSFLSQGRSPSCPPPAHDKIILNQRGSLSGIVRVNHQSLKRFGTSWLIHPQIRADWDSEQSVCVILNIESNQITVIIILVTDIILLSTMLVGLLRLRRGGGGKFELGRLLWKQVKCWQPLLTVVLLICKHIRKGVIWLSIGTVAELTPVVSLLALL